MQPVVDQAVNGVVEAAVPAPVNQAEPKAKKRGRPPKADGEKKGKREGNAGKKKRKRYEAQYKVEVAKFFQQNGMEKTCETYPGVDRSMITRWVTKLPVMTKVNPHAKSVAKKPGPKSGLTVIEETVSNAAIMSTTCLERCLTLVVCFLLSSWNGLLTRDARQSL